MSKQNKKNEKLKKNIGSLNVNVMFYFLGF